MRFISSFLLLACLQSAVVVRAQHEPVCKAQDQIVALERATAAKKLQFRSSDFTDNYDLKYHRLEWQVDPAQQYISGTVTSYFVVTEATNAISFDLDSALQVTQVAYHGQTISFTHHLEDFRLEAHLPETVGSGTLDSLHVTYAGAPRTTGFGSFVSSAHQGTPVLWTLSEPYGARDWWPCKLSLTDKIDSVDIWVTTHDTLRAASNGLLVDSIFQGSQVTWHWRHRYPIATYLIAIAVTNYDVYSDWVVGEDDDSLEVLNYVYPESLAQAAAATPKTVALIELFRDLFGEYPFKKEKYGHAQFGFGGGMEHQTMSFMGGWSTFLQAHELAHQWFGDEVTCGSWQDIWLNEGFATYLDGLSREAGIGSGDFHSWLESQINSVTSDPGGSVFVPDTTNVSRIFSGRLSYRKGAMLLHMLRWKLGDEDFFQAIRNYRADPDLAYGFARTSDLQGHLEAVSGDDLDEFFDDWYYGEGYPSYQITYGYTPNGVELLLEQTSSHPSVEFFEMPIPIRMIGQDLDTIVVVDHTHNGQIVSIDLPTSPWEFQFDPELWILSRDNMIDSEVSAIRPGIAESPLKVYPNPARDEVWLSAQSPLEEVRLYDLSGRLWQLWRTPSSTQVRLDLTDIPSGHYMAVGRSETQMARGLVVVR